MTHASGSVHGEGWFVALPDHEATLAVSTSPILSHVRRLAYDSGRPWLMGNWDEEAITVAAAGPLKVALIGRSSLTEAELAQALRPLRDVHELSRLLPRLAGAFHVVATDGTGLRVQGTVTGTCRVFHARVGQAGLAASRADVLARLAGASIDDRALSTRLLLPDAPHPLHGQSLWCGVRSLPEGAYVHIVGDRPGRVVNWWVPPTPELSLAEGAPRLRTALDAAVAAATRGGGSLSCDLSGGLDSTPLCFLTARRAEHLTTFTFDSTDPTDDDPYWVRTALAALPDAEPVFVSEEEAPLPFDGVSEPGTAMDEPFTGLEDRTANLERPRLLAGRSRLHLTGHGGDEVLECLPNYLHDLVRSRPRLAWQHLQAYRPRYRWPLRSALAALADHRGYAEWFTTTLSGLGEPPSPSSELTYLAWGLPSRLPPWGTPRAAEAVRSLAAELPCEPLAESRGRHETLEGIRRSGRDTRMLAWLMADNGLPMAAPLLDDRVVEACLAVLPYERTTPWRYKPLIVEAMRGVVPGAGLRRMTKGDNVTAGELEYQGLRRHRTSLIALAEDSRLAARGLIDPALLRRTCAGSFLPGMSPAAVATTIACEAWLRDVESAATHPLPGPRRPT